MSISLTLEDRIAPYMLSNSHAGIMAAIGGKDHEKASWIGMEVMNVLGYFPGVSLIVGIARIIFSQTAKMFTDLEELSKKDQKFAKGLQEAQLVRGILECCTVFGPLQFIVDLAVSIFGLAMMVSEDKL